MFQTICAPSVACLLIGGAVATAHADDGLPRGKDAGPGVKFSVQQIEDPDTQCYDYLANPDQGYVSFNPFGKLAYLVGKSGDKNAADVEIKSYILEVQLEKKKVYKKFNLRVVDNAALVAHQEPTAAVTILNFTAAEFACGQGLSAGIGVSWGKAKEVVKTFEKSRYKITRASSGQQLVDRSNNTISRFDLNVKQRRVIASLARVGIPLYADLNAKKSIHYLPGEERQLLRFDIPTLKKEAEIKLAAGMRVIQQDGYFAIVTTDRAANQFIVNTIPSWSGVPSQRWQYPILDKKIEDLRLFVDFQTGIGVVTPRNKILAKKIDHFDVIRGKDHVEKLIRRIKLQRGQYLAIAEPFPLTDQMLLVTKEVGSDQLASLSLYDIDKNLLEPLRIDE